MKKSSTRLHRLKCPRMQQLLQSIDIINVYAKIVSMVTHCHTICHSYFYAPEA